MDFQTKWVQLNKFRKMPAAEKRIVAVATALLPCTIVGLRLFGFKRWSGGLNHWARRWPYIGEDERQSIRRTLYLMSIAMRLSPHPGNCLSQSVTLWWLLKCQGIESDLRIGVRSLGDQLQAHAWIEYKGYPLNEMADVKKRFVAFSEPVLTDMKSKVEFEEKAE